MSVLEADIWDETSGKHIGKAQINEIDRLSSTNPLKG
jgi:hypothetical protein